MFKKLLSSFPPSSITSEATPTRGSSRLIFYNQSIIITLVRTRRMMSSNHKNSTTSTPTSTKKHKTRSKPKPKPFHSNSNNHTSSSYPYIEFHEFESFLKANPKTKRYKVHKPQCTCPKIQSFIKQHQQQHTLDGLIVIPDTISTSSSSLSTTKSLYIHTQSPLSKFNNDPLFYEMQLRNIIYQSSDTTKNDNDNNNFDHEKNIKVSCASCLLENSNENGFVCIISSSKSIIDDTINKANENKIIKTSQGGNKGLHSDHADYLCTVPINILLTLFLDMKKEKIDKKKRNGQGRFNHEENHHTNSLLHTTKRLYDCIIHQHPNMSKIQFDDDIIKNKKLDVKLGHHLTSILTLCNKVDDRRRNQYIMITLMATERTNNNNNSYANKNSLIWKVDIPGGKRYLGETSLQCAIRETEEETSLVIDEKWLDSLVEDHISESFRQNRYYFLQPPVDVMLDSVLKDSFWNPPTNT